MKPQVISGDNFQSEVLQSDQDVLVDFFADWCQPCRTLSVILEKIGERKNGTLKIVKLDVMKASKVAEIYMVSTLPTVLLFKKGEIAGGLVGLHNPRLYEELIEGER